MFHISHFEINFTRAITKQYINNLNIFITMFDNKLYYQKNKSRIREYQYSHYNINAEIWKDYHNKYKQQAKNINKKLLPKWKNYRDEHRLRVVQGPFII